MGYKGKHRAPSETGPRLAKFGSAALAAAALPLVSTGNAEAASPNQILEAIAQCESGNKNVNNSTGASTASGYLQIINGTWRAHGGTQYASRAIGASRGEQFIVGRAILASQGLAAWSESRSCWQNKIGKIPVAAMISSEDANPQAVVTRVRPPARTLAPTPAKNAARSYVIKRGDTLAKIAKRNGTTWRSLYNLNRGTVRNPNLIYPGNTLRLG